jgi:hypothetical protein
MGVSQCLEWNRVQYFVVSLGEKREKVVGVAVKAVES